ncbi:MAG: hypothetical protein U0169_27005 [Polyangiaceae bacterium]
MSTAARRHVLASLEKLDEAEQTLAVLAFCDGCTQEEIGKETEACPA